eukprot:CAMPEP_0198465684 /NCGR_PEP_ID=MMETSP1456-20131121/3519_1 /TAXON_ID=1461544 ORGANISM="Unidentified sp., Strain RCC1871" /NCGR_SAMPLE_ID=MMETSP1456 /ASSEMBLY_ACC=CAM_ASM_001119 /LENGTH=151 /DNA_ID=CAMNT_0044191559 /DNA_START=239 /DNA_END=692 /DNA_ORIENTATION=+
MMAKMDAKILSSKVPPEKAATTRQRATTRRVSSPGLVSKSHSGPSSPKTSSVVSPDSQRSAFGHLGVVVLAAAAAMEGRKVTSLMTPRPDVGRPPQSTAWPACCKPGDAHRPPGPDPSPPQGRRRSDPLALSSYLDPSASSMGLSSMNPAS